MNLKLGRYLLKKWLGGGRFGDVYLAEDTLLNKDFAIKVIRSSGNIDNILEEAKLLADLQHPNIVRFYTVDMVDDRLIIVMEYVKGTSLRKIIDKESPISKERAVFYAEQLLNALHFAHSRGVIHRDIKPENIIVTNDGFIKLLDFGLAKLFEGDLSMSMGGTPLYMAPETWKGEFSALSDQWSVAVILVEMLTGRHPFRSESLDELREKINKEIDVDSINIPDELVEPIAKALARNPQERFENCLEFAKSINPKTVKVELLRIGDSKKIDMLNLLSDEQKEAVFEDKSNVLLIGGPGTGKTYALTARALRLVKEGIAAPPEILITTFNIRGYREIEARLEKVLGSKVEDMWLGNFHQIALRILSRFGYLLGLPEDFSIIPPSQRKQLAKKIAQNLTTNVPASDAVIKDILNRFHFARANLMDKEEFLASSTGRWHSLLEDFWEIYHETIVSERSLDYDDLVYFCALLFKKYPEVVEFYKSRIHHILVDEAQDLNKAQIFIIERLGEGKRLFITGDDDQSIYQWRGAQPEYMKLLKEDPSFKVFKLTKSFRLPKDIRDAAFNLIQFNRNRIPKLFWTSKEGSRFYIDVKALNTPQDEADFVCDIIDILKLKEGYSYSDFCVLYRTNARGRLFEQVFKKRKIPYSFQFGKSFYRREEILLAIDLLKYSVNPGPLIKKRILSKSYVLGITFEEAKEERELEALLEKVKECKRPTEVLSLLLRYVGIKKGDPEGVNGLVRLNSIDELFKQAKDFEERSRTKTISGFLNYVKFLVDSGLAEEDEGVRLLSVHSAKGLEFPVVFLVGMVEGEFPLSKAMGIEEEMEEERRLCYTAITRATEKLFITYYRFSSRYTRFEEKPSRFLKEMLGL